MIPDQFPTPAPVSDVISQFLFKILAAFIIWHFFWTLAGLLIDVLPPFADSTEGSRQAFSVLPTVIIGTSWYLRSLNRRYARHHWRAHFPPTREAQLHYWFLFTPDFMAGHWLYTVLPFGLLDAVLTRDWAFAAVVLFAVLGFIYRDRLEGTIERV